MEILVLASFTFLSRLIFLDDDNDNWMVWYCLNNQNERWINLAAENSITPGYQGRPQLFYFIVSRFPEAYRAQAGVFLTVLFDVLSVLTVYFFSYQAFSGQLQSNDLPFWAALVFASSPILTPVTARLTGIKARTFGAFLTILYFITLGPTLFIHPAI